MGDIDCDDFGIESAMRRATRIRWQNSRTVPYVPVDADDCAPGLEAMPPQAGLAVAVVFTDGGMVYQLQRDGGRVCEVAKWGALPVTAEMMEDAGLPRHAAAFRRWHDVDCDRPSPGDDITHAMDRQASPLRTDR